MIVLDPKGDAADAVLSVVPRDAHAARCSTWRRRPPASTRSRSTAPPTRSPTTSWRRCAGCSRRRGSRQLGPLPAQRADRRARLRARRDAVGRRAAARGRRRGQVAARPRRRAARGDAGVRRAGGVPRGGAAGAAGRRACDARRRSSTRRRTSSPASSTRRRSSGCCSTTRCRSTSTGIIERREVLVVRGALGEVGAGNVAVLMQLLLGMLDAALGRVQDRRRDRAACGGGAQDRRGAAGDQRRVRTDARAEAIGRARDRRLLADRRAVGARAARAARRALRPPRPLRDRLGGGRPRRVGAADVGVLRSAARRRRAARPTRLARRAPAPAAAHGARSAGRRRAGASGRSSRRRCRSRSTARESIGMLRPSASAVAASWPSRRRLRSRRAWSRRRWCCSCPRPPCSCR